MPPRRATLAAALAAAACAPRAFPFAPRRAPFARGPRVRGGGRGATVPPSAEAEEAESRKVEPLVRALWNPAPAAPAEGRAAAPSFLDVVKSEVKKNGPAVPRAPAAIQPAEGPAPSFLDVVQSNPTVSKPLGAATLAFVAIGFRNSAVKRQTMEDSRERGGGTAKGVVRAAPVGAEAAPAASGVELWSVGYDDSVKLAYEAAGSPRGFDAFKAKYLEETSAMVAKKGLIGAAPAATTPAKAEAAPAASQPVEAAPVRAAPAAPPAAPLGDLARDIRGQIDEIDAMLGRFADGEVKENLGRQKRDLEEMLEFAVQNGL